jgi:hypothetical protein
LAWRYRATTPAPPRPYTARRNTGFLETFAGLARLSRPFALAAKEDPMRPASRVRTALALAFFLAASWLTLRPARPSHEARGAQVDEPRDIGGASPETAGPPGRRG